MTTRNALDTLDSVNASSLRFIRVGRLGYFAVKWCGHGRFYLQGEDFMDESTPARSFTLLERTVILGIYTVALFAVHRISSGSWIPSSGLEDLWLISAIGLLSFDLLSSPFFVKPSDVLASTLASLLLLWSLDLDNLQTFSYELNYFRWFSFAITTIIMIFSIVAIVCQKRPSSVYSQEHVRAIPNLKPLHALVFGKGINSERPVIVQIPFDEGKKRASEELHYGKCGNEE